MSNDSRKLATPDYIKSKLFDKFYVDKETITLNETVYTVDKTASKILEEFKDQPSILLINRGKTKLSTEAEKIISDNHIPYIELMDTLNVLHEDPFFWAVSKQKGHWNHTAHRAIGNYLADKLKGHYP